MRIGTCMSKAPLVTLSKNLTLNLFFYISTFIYLIFINYSYAYLHTDEFAAVSVTTKEAIDAVYLHTRISHLFSIIPTNILKFTDPGPVQLIPRLLSMIGIATAIFYILNNLKINKNYSGIIIFASVVLHQLDSFHNGLIAFFGGYNLFFLIYFIILIKSLNRFGGEKSERNIIYTLILTVLLLISYASEIFVISSTIVSLYYLIYRKDKIYNPFFLSLLIYLITFLYIRLNGIEANINSIQNYLIGNVGSRSIQEIMTVAVLYLFNSIPYVGILKLGIGIQVTVVIIFLCMIMCAGYLIFRRNNNLKNNNVFQVFIAMCVVGIVPQILMALQPNKTMWALDYGISRYAFSLYTWILYVISLFVIINKLADNLNKKIKFLINYTFILGFLSFSYLAIKANLSFINKYKDAKHNWRLIANIAKSAGESGVIKVSSDLLYNPGPLPINVERFKKFISINFQKQSLVCFGVDGLDFSKILPDEKTDTSISGFSAPEKHGRWTNDDISYIVINKKFLSGDVVNLEITDLYGVNKGNPSRIKMNNQEKIVTTAKILEFVVDVLSNKIEIQIIPFKAKDLGPDSQIADPRRLGLMVKKISVTRKVDGKIIHLTESCR